MSDPTTESNRTALSFPPTAGPLEVRIGIRGRLWISQAIGEPLAADVTAMTFTFPEAAAVASPEQVLVQPEGRWAPHPQGSIGRRIQMRNGRTLADLESTNPGLVDDLQATYPHLPW